MTSRNNSKLVMHLDRQKITIAGTHLETPLLVDLPLSIALDIDIVDPESLNQLLVNFLEQSLLPPSEVVLIISEAVYYEKDIILSLDTVERQKQIDAFLETVPYKNLVFKDYTLGGQPKLVAVNKNFYEPIVKFFEKNNFNITIILPIFALNQSGLKLDTFVSKEIKDIYQKYKQIQPLSLVSSQEIDKMVTTVVHFQKEDNKRAIILLVVFCLLFVTLLVYIFVVPRFYKPPVTKVPITTPTVISTPTPPESTPVPTQNFLAESLLRIKVVNSSGVTNQAAKIKQLLIDAKFVEIKTFSSSKVIATKNQISFSSKVSPESRQKIRVAVESLAGPSSEIELTEVVDFDIVITTVTTP